MKPILNQLAVFLITLLVFINSASATNGYFAHGYSAKEKGRAGTGVARGVDSLSAANNPANLLDVGDRIEAGAALFMPFRSYNVLGEPSLANGFTPVIGGFPGCAQAGVQPCQIPFSITPGKVDSDREFFIIPHFGYSKKVSENFAWGIAVYGNGGMNTDYDSGSANLFNPETNSIETSAGTFGAGKTGVDLSQLFINSSVAYKTTQQLSIGVGFIFAVQRFQASGLAAFANNSLDADKLTDNGHQLSYGVGLKLGATYHLSEDLSVGLSYQPEINMSKFDDYAGLFAEAGNFDIPSTYTVGFVWNTSANSSFYFDLQEISYSDIPAIANGISALLNGSCNDALNNFLLSGVQGPATGSGCLGGEDGAGFGWDDVTVYKFGYEWGTSNNQWRVGYSTTNQPINSNELNFNILSPGVVEEHFTAGFTRVTADNNEWTISLMYAPTVKLTGPSRFDPAQTISTQMDQLELGFSYKF